MAMVSLQSCYDRARGSMAQGEYDKAEAICRHILQYYPQDLGTFQLLGQINLERKQARTAREYFRQVLEIDPENVSAHWGMGIAYQDERNLEQAIAEFEQALEIKPDLSDLRSQLLRLYTELYGASRAQLHLNRAGLGRLYVKGDMPDKAIEEFREVLKVDPSRVDVQLSLIEVLWQSGQVAEAARVCEAVLERLPNALKANLILGYVRMEAGRQQEGEELLRRAAGCDPNNTMARAIFEMAPVRVSPGLLAFDAATLPDFDEAAWLARPAVVEAPPPEEEIVAPPAPEAPREEVAAPAKPVPAPAEAGVGVSWLDTLATGEGRVEEVVEEELVPGLAPFSLEGFEQIGAGPPEGPGALPPGEMAVPAVPPAPRAGQLEEEAAIPGLQLPESLLGEEAVAPTEAVAPEQVMQPFSLEDLGLSAEEIASLEQAVATAQQEGGAPGAGVTRTPAEALPEEEGLIPGLAPFSLDEAMAPAGLEEAGATGPASFPLEAAAAPAGGKEAALPGLEPFSLEEGLGLGAEEEEIVPGLEPFSVEPFSMEGMAGAEAAPAIPAGELKPFSLDDLGLEEPAEAEPVSLDQLGLEEGEEALGLPAFSWQEAGMREAPAYRGELGPKKEEEVPGGPSLFEKMMARRREAAGPGEEEPAVEAAPVMEEAAPAEELVAEGVEPFSLAEMGLGGEEPAPQAEGALPAEELVAEGVEPFSLEELGLGEAMTPPARQKPAEPKPFSLEELGLEETLTPAEKEEGLAGLDLFSLEGLGLEEAAAEPGPAGLKPFSLEQLGLEQALTPAGGEAAPIEGLDLEGVPPFSLEELGLEAAPAEAEEGKAPVEAAPAAAAVPEEGVVRPFTLEELGLTPEEIAGLGLGTEEVAPAPVAEAVAPAVVEEAIAAVPAEEVPAAAVEEVVPEAGAGPSLDELRRQYAAQPADEGLRLSLARAVAEQGEYDEAVEHYKALLKTGQAGIEDAVAAQLQVWIEREQDPKWLHRLHRLLGDAYMKKGLYQQAINEFAWVLSKP